MTFAAALAAGCTPIALEITPPRRPLPGVLHRRAALLGACARAINVIQRPDRLSSLDASLLLRAAGFQPVWHLVNRGRTRDAIAADLARAREGGIGQVLCIRGDHAGEDTPDTPPIRAVIAMVRGRMPDALIGATLNQYAADQGAVLRNLLPKLVAGAGYVQTQPVFDVDTLRPFVELLRQRSPETRIVPMVMPLLSVEAAGAIEARLGIRLPEPLCRGLERAGAEAAWQTFGETVAALVGGGLADGLAVMTFETDPDAATGARIIAALRRAGVVPAQPAAGDV